MGIVKIDTSLKRWISRFFECRPPRTRWMPLHVWSSETRPPSNTPSRLALPVSILRVAPSRSRTPRCTSPMKLIRKRPSLPLPALLPVLIELHLHFSIARIQHLHFRQRHFAQHTARVAGCVISIVDDDTDAGPIADPRKPILRPIWELEKKDDVQPATTK